MFRLHKEISRLDIPAQRVLRLERSLSDVQVAMPGLPAQHATAFLCSFSAGQGTRVAVVLQLHTSGLLAFFLNEEGEVARSEGTRIYNQGLDFAESMGFMFGDLDIHLKSLEERNTLWASLPLLSGVKALPSAAPPAAGPTAPPQAAAPPVAAPAVRSAAATAAPPKAVKARKPITHPEATGPLAEAAASVQRTLPATQAPAAAPSNSPSPLPPQPVPTKVSSPPLIEAPGPSSHPVPSGAELAAKRKELREHLGRFLASF